MNRNVIAQVLWSLSRCLAGTRENGRNNISYAAHTRAHFDPDNADATDIYYPPRNVCAFSALRAISKRYITPSYTNVFSVPALGIHQYQPSAFLTLLTLSSYFARFN